MAEKKSDLILHPIRLRLMTELAGRQMTAQQLAEALPDVAQASLYRHIKRLLEGGVFEIVAEQLVNGAVERTLAVVAGQTQLSLAEAQAMTAVEHIRAFNIFAASLIESFSRYADGADPAYFMVDGVSYSRAVIYLTDEERAEFQQAIMNLMGQVMSNQPQPGRKRYTLASVVIPDERG
jgi:DNA-binding transcriptional ArsR family regulator